MSDLLDPQRRWTVSRTNPEYLRFLARQLSISPVLAQILINRGLRTPENIGRFLNPSLDHLHEPAALPDLQPACDRINQAAKRGESVLVVGDYDVDGLTSTAILTDVLEKLGLVVDYVIPHRLVDGYGLKGAFIEEAARRGRTLVITVDCGITATAEADLAARLGIDLIITDHHRPTGPIPRATAVVNPHRADSSYPFPDLAGVGVVYKLAEALLGRETATPYLDLVALGTVADVVPLLDENRVFVQAGLAVLSKTPRAGISALCEISGLDVSSLTSGRLSYMLVPRLNAAGRMGDAHPVVRLLRTKDLEEARVLSASLDQANRERQKLDNAVFQQARVLAEAAEPSDVVVLGSPDWHPGVLGIAAARLVEVVRRPVFLLSIENGLAKGSGRSIGAFNLVSALESCSDVLQGFGGHHQAAGIRLRTEQMETFRRRMADVFRSSIASEDILPSLNIDAEVTPADITLNLLRDLESLEPSGFKNESPLLGCKGLKIAASRLVGRNHLKLRLSGAASTLDAILFDAGEKLLEDLSQYRRVDVAFVARINEWEGRQSVQMHLRALRGA